MATTQNTYTGDGSTTNYSLTFEYIKPADVKVTVASAATTQFTFANATTLSFNTAPANGAAIRIFRDTDITTLNATFFPGSAIKAEDLNNNFTQTHFATQETDNEVVTANTTATAANTAADNAVTAANSAVTTANAATTTANTADTNASAAVTTANAASTTAAAAAAVANTASTDAASAVTTANTASTTAGTAATTANSAVTTANSAVTTANTANTNSANAVTTANTASTDSAAAVSTANTALTNASAAVTTANASTATANTADTNASAAVTTANAASATANTASTDAASAVTTANTASTNASAAVTTANTAATDAATAISTANSAVSTANTASSVATTATTTANGAVTTANTADTNATNAVAVANAASAAVSAAVLFTLIANISAIPGSPSNNDYVEIGDSTGIQSFSPLSGLPSGFVGATGLTVRLRYQTATTSWVFMSYFANDSETRYLTKNIPVVTGDSTNGSGQITLNCENNSHGVKIKGPPHSAAATYTLTLPNDAGTSGNVLKTDGSGTTSWGSADVVNDTTPQLGGDLDVNGHEIVSGGSNTDIIIDAARNLTLRADSNGTNGEVQIVGGPLNCASITNVSTLSGSTPVLRGLNGTSGTAALQIMGNNTAGNPIYSELKLDNQNLTFTTGGSERLRIDSSGKVGIGTSSPTVSYGNGLHIAGSQAGIKLQNTNNGDWAYVEYADESNTTKFIQGYRDASGVYAIRPGTSLNATPGLSLDSSGNVGISTTSPSARLDVKGTVSAGGGNDEDLQQWNIGSDNVKAEIKYIDSSSNRGMRFGTSTGHNLAFQTNNTERMRIYGSDGGLSLNSYLEFANQAGNGYCGYLGNGADVIASGSSADLGVRSQQNLIFAAGGSSERMRVDSSGKVGIGKSSPNTTLDIYDATEPYIYLQNSTTGTGVGDGFSIVESGLDTYINNREAGNMLFYNNSAERMRVDSSGRVLVGTTTEGHASADTLTISDSTNSGLTIRSGTSSQGSIYFSDATTGAGEYAGYMRYDHNYNNFAIGTVGTERLRIDSSGRLFAGGTVATPSTTSSDDIVIAGAGNVGLTINSTNSAESAIFFADGTSGSSQYMGQVSYYHSTDSLIFASAGSERLRIDSSGRVMIGTTSQGHVSADDLTISSSGSTGMTIRSDSSGYGSLFFADAGSDYAGAVEYQHSTDTLRFYVGATNRLQIAPAGQIGLGGANYGTAGQVITSNGSGSAPTWQNTSIPALATQAEAEAGTNNTKMMTPLRVAQAINAVGGSVINSIQRGTTQVGAYQAGYYSAGTITSTVTNVSITSVDTTKTMVNITGSTNDNVYFSLTSATQVTATRGTAVLKPTYGSYEIIEFN